MNCLLDTGRDKADFLTLCAALGGNESCISYIFSNQNEYNFTTQKRLRKGCVNLRDNLLNHMQKISIMVEYSEGTQVLQ